MDPAIDQTSGDQDMHLSIDPILVEVDFCNNRYKSRQILIDGADVVARIAGLIASSSSIQPGSSGATDEFACASFPDPATLTDGILEASVDSFTSDDARLPGKTYRVYIAGNTFLVNPIADMIYRIDGFDGDIGGALGSLWHTYTNAETGFSFKYPVNSDSNTGPWAGSWGISNGAQGRYFFGEISLRGGTTIDIYSNTPDYVAVPTDKDTQAPIAVGFVKKGTQYHYATGGAFMPDDIWTLGNGIDALVTYGNDYDSTADFFQDSADVTLNTSNPSFPDLDLRLTNMNGENPNGPQIGPATPAHIAILKKIVSSIRFTR